MITTTPAVARAAGMTVDALLELLETPEMAAKLERLQRIVDMRAKLLATTAETAALGALTAHMAETRTGEAERTQVANALKAAHARKDEPSIQRAQLAIAELDARSKKLTESARSARATLTHARSRARSQVASQEPAPSPSAGDKSGEGGRVGLQHADG